jgi:hypothetical protein
VPVPVGRWPRRAYKFLRNQPLTALGASSCQYLAAILRGHAGAKTMRACASDLARLVSAFHDSTGPEIGRKMGGQGTVGPCACQYANASGAASDRYRLRPLFRALHPYRQPPD